ncbi:glutathione S-transferase T3-like [Salvia hispanica]|uniref:glutathione S-transferase T3-like n=1 Tax=Salvia hispanica TaxID=49212 RepID=UPI002009AEDD|nr:glutathione S-transferase T3-like [Salvia hispanica]
MYNCLGTPRWRLRLRRRIGLRLGVNAEEEAEEEVVGDGTRHPYSQDKTLVLYDAWISVSYDPVVGNQQTNKCFWQKVTEVYNARRPKKTVARNVKMLRSHWDRCDRDVKNFCAIYRAEEANYQSVASGADILRAELRVFKDDIGKDFKFVDVWSQVHHLESPQSSQLGIGAQPTSGDDDSPAE